ncbi:ABC transporter ATP-binding protein [Lysinibacillus xylanilyticus]|uniref:ABC transporter ATP-binding protein n=1 Tax=Lysinibacillus xylanilyticus TaxID=582475 RepID=UPI0037F56F66
MKPNYLKRSMLLVWTYAKSLMFISFLISILEGLLPLASVTLAMKLVNNVTLAIKDNVFDSTIITLLIIQFFITIIPSILRIIQEYINKKVEIKLEYHITLLSSEKLMSIPYSFFDSPDFHDKYARISDSGSVSIQLLTPIQHTLQILSSLISILAVGIFIINTNIVIFLLAILSAIPIFLIGIIFGNRQYNLRIKQTTKAREAGYIQYLLQTKDSIKEIRVYQFGNYLLDKWGKIFLEINKEILAMLKKQQIWKSILLIISSLIYIIAIWVTISSIQIKGLDIGSYIALTQGFIVVQGGVNIISRNVSELYVNRLYIKEFFDFIDIEDTQIGDTVHRSFPSPIKSEIIFNNVSFTYPHSENKSLENINFSVKPNERIAIIGENGSGKTTLIKCLMGLYDVTEGDICIDGVNIKEIDRVKLSKNISAIFQDYMKYSFSVHENIILGDWENKNNLNKVKKVAIDCGVDDFVNKFTNKYDTRLGKIFEEGEDISGGQWQKLALARAIFRDSQVIVLDEPTSAMDINSELHFLNTLKNVTKDKICIYISHRLNYATLADKIIVMKDGNIVELGDHKSLINEKGLYYSMYQKQYKTYKKDKDE